MTETPPPKRRLFGLVLALALGAVFVIWTTYYGSRLPTTRQVPYSELVSAVNEGRLVSAEITAHEIRGELAKPVDGAKAIVTDRVPNLDERTLVEAMTAKGVVVNAEQSEPSLWTAALGLLPWLLIPLLLWGGSALSAIGNAQGKPLTFARSRAKLYDRSSENKATFADVAGVDEAKAELAEVVRFLKEPDRYRSVGARIPKGVLLVGAPGTGKTLLARAVAGESGVPFFSMSGSEFVEMFVGVGASRVRDLFVQAKERAPCIIFVDELDAVGKARSGARGFAANEEREQTLNQLLVEMDGFDSGSGLVIMAATNRPEILDPALLRAGRFDRQVLVDRPDVRGREAILKVHARRVAIGPDVELAMVAQRTPGMVGADLAKVVNEAALASVRREAKQIDAQDFDEAIDRIQLGLKKEGRVMNDDEKRRVAYHEAGHALVALSMAHADPVHRVSIIPRSIGALGTTLQLPTEERYLMTRAELHDRICVYFGGRAAEDIACRDISTGAADDLERATELARQMVCRFGMSRDLGPLAVGQGASLLNPSGLELRGDGLSDATRALVDREVRTILDEEQARAHAKIMQARSALTAIAEELLARETLQRADLERLLEKTRVAGANGSAAQSAVTAGA